MVGDAGLHHYENLDDDRLVKAILEGDDRAVVALLIGRCGPSLKYLTQCRFPMLGLAFDEVVSEVFVALRKNDWKALRQFRGEDADGKPCRLTTYVSTIASRLLWKKMDKAVKEIEWKAPPIGVNGLAIQDERSGRAWEVAEVMDAIMALENAEDRDLLLLYKVEGRSAQEVAQRLGMSPGNVYTRCCRALKELRTMMEEGRGHA